MEFPVMLSAAEEKAAYAQTQFVVFSAIQLGLLIIVPVSSFAPVGWAGNVGPICALIAALGALIIQLSGVVVRAERSWYDARAAAESIKTSSWEFSVGGEAFRLGDIRAEVRFESLMHSILSGLSRFDVPHKGLTSSGSVTGDMKAARASSLVERAELYQRARVDDQISWYSAKSLWNRRRNRQFVVVASAFQIAAVVFGIFRVNGHFGPDLLGIFSTGAAALLAWMQAKKYANLSEVYAVTSHEVNLVSNSGWAQAVHDAEAAFSREHTMWLARRQGPV
jgi:hypothetical protein